MDLVPKEVEMSPLLQADFENTLFDLFGPTHWAAIGLLVLAIVSLPLIRQWWDERSKRILRYALIGWILFWEIAYTAWNIYHGTWSVQQHLPLHLSSVTAWLSMYMLATKSYSAYELVYFAGLGGASQALLTPDTGADIPAYFRIIQIFSSHSAIILAALYMTIVEGYRPTLKSVKRVFILLNIYVILIFFVNMALGSNYLFIAYKPTTFFSLLDYLAPWPWYILEMEGIALVIFALLYLPYFIKDLRVRRQAVATSSASKV